MYKIIVLSGKQDSGKTTTLKMVVKMLLNDKARLIVFSKNFGAWLHDCQTIGDIWAIMEYNGKTIFITTRGDYPKSILDDVDCALNLAKLSLNEIDIFICAAHNIAQVQKVFRKKGLTLSNPIVIDKTVSSNAANYAIDNANDAKGLFSNI